MKRYLFILAAVFGFATSSKALDYETAREQAYYLTDKMAYELNLSDEQYNDAYEINLDYLLSLNSPSDIELAYLRHRNEDLKYILMDWQWRAFMAAEYLYNPVRWVSGAWYFPIYRHYTRTHYFYSRPSIYWDYRGAHARRHYTHSYYVNRRPHWNGGLRGHSHTMVGRPNNRPGGPNRFERPTGRPKIHPENRSNRGERPKISSRPNREERPKVGERPITSSRPNVSERPNRSERPNVSNSSTRRPQTGNSSFNRGNNSSRRNSGNFNRSTMRSSSRTTVSTMRSRGNDNSRSARGGNNNSRSGGNNSRNGRR